MKAARPALRRRDRGVLHGLSLVALTVVLFGAVAFFALFPFRLRCTCADTTSLELNRNGYESPKDRCQAACAAHGGGAPSTHEPKKGLRP